MRSKIHRLPLGTALVVLCACTSSAPRPGGRGALVMVRLTEMAVVMPRAAGLARQGSAAMGGVGRSWPERVAQGAGMAAPERVGKARQQGRAG
ncbi:hypothetical protein [Chondromyces crocatus]|uniref:Uncharacterized protein n=1 Tax=Chondromyces crocatus TaxID=52 RepID=A0A0K1EF93_CHOCO|nr:hypothetical protein [Chondromyces crocatus]AKT39536.1 uncharacterized protein CMC5_036830 [Chondromyces crocatus]